MRARSKGMIVLFLTVSIVAIGAVWLELSADEHAPEVLPITTTRLSPAEIETASAMAFDDKSLSDKLADHRYEIVEAERCEKKNLGEEGACWRIGIFDYDAGVCTHVFINASSNSIEQVLETGCSTSEKEFSDARAIAESDPLVREALDAFDDEKFIRGKTWFPRLAQEGHRYVEVRWSVDGGTAGAEFVVDLTTRTVCHECR